MAGSVIVLQLWKNGRSILTVKPGPKVDPKQALIDTFDRVAFYTPDGTSSAPAVVIDSIASAGVPDPNEDTYFALTVDPGGSIKSLSLQCLIRCYIAGGMEPFVRFKGVLVPSTVNSQWLAFDSLTFGEDAFSGFEIKDLKTRSGHVPQGLAPVLPAVLGLKLKLGQSGRTEVSFKPAPQPAPPGAAFSDPSSTQVVRFTRPIVFERAAQEIAVDPVRIAIAAGAIASLGLDGGCAQASGVSGALIQTHLAITDNLALSPSAVGRWAVSIQGVPSPGVIDAWNASIVTPYLAALGTIAAGQPISGMPELKLPADPPAPACDSVRNRGRWPRHRLGRRRGSARQFPRPRAAAPPGFWHRCKVAPGSLGPLGAAGQGRRRHLPPGQRHFRRPHPP